MPIGNEYGIGIRKTDYEDINIYTATIATFMDLPANIVKIIIENCIYVLIENLLP